MANDGERAKRNREKRTRADGTPIDPTQDLDAFLQSYEMSGTGLQEEQEPEPPKPAAAPPPTSAPAAATAPPQTAAPAVAPAATPPAAPAPVPAPTPVQLPETVPAAAQSARELQLQAELEQLRIADAARRAVEQHVNQQRTVQQQSAPPAPDPRLQEIQDNWFTDPARSQQLMMEIQQERIQKELEQLREKVKQEFRGETEEERRSAQAHSAYNEAMNALHAAGVPAEHLRDRNRLTALYTVITRASTPDLPNPYYDRGSMLDARVIQDAWRDLFGTGAGSGSAPAPAAAPAPALAPAPAVAPPGSSRPAPAAAAPSTAGTTQVHLPAADKRDIDHLANELGADPAKLEERRRRRLANDRR